MPSSSSAIFSDNRDNTCDHYTVTEPPTGGRSNGEPLTSDPRRARALPPHGMAAGTSQRRDDAVRGVPSAARRHVPQPVDRAAADRSTGARRPYPGLPERADGRRFLKLHGARPYPRGVVQPPVGTTLHKGAPIGFGDCLTFDHVDDGPRGWVERRNGSMRGRRVSWRVVAFWLPMDGRTLGSSTP